MTWFFSVLVILEGRSIMSSCKEVNSDGDDAITDTSDALSMSMLVILPLQSVYLCY